MTKETSLEVVDAVADLQRTRQAVQSDGATAHKPSKREWWHARQDGFERAKFTGRVAYVVEWNQGGISRMREEIFQSSAVAP